MVDSAELWARHNKVVVFVKLLIGSWVLDEFISALSHPKLLIWVAVRFELNSIEQPSLNQWSPEEIGGRYIDDTTSRDCSWGSVVQVLDLKSHLGGIRHWNSLGVGEGKNSIIIEHSVEVLNPNGIYWSVTNNPRSVLVALGIALLPDL